MHIQSVDTKQAVALIHTEQPLILDTRDAQSFAQQHIAQAQHVTANNVQQLLSECAPTQCILVYCYHGMGSLSWVNMLINAGFKQTYNLQGGFSAWVAEGGDALLSAQGASA